MRQIRRGPAVVLNELRRHVEDPASGKVGDHPQGSRGLPEPAGHRSGDNEAVRYLPTGEEQEWLVDALAALIQRQGYEPFILAPIVQPNREHFPEASGQAAYVLDRATRRMLQYVGMGDLDVLFEAFAENEPVATEHGTGCGTTAAYFRGIEDGCCFFGLNIQGSADAEYLAGVMCHEVAHAYRRKHSLETEDRDEEERLTDLTTTYLGFGILSANNSLRYRSAGDLDETRWSTSSTGYLTPQAMSFLLALQAWGRETTSKQRKRIADFLEPNQRAFFVEAFKHIDGHRNTFNSRLELPDRRSWPSARNVETILRPLPEFQPWTDDGGEDLIQPTLPNEGYPVFRVRKSRALASGVAGLFLSSAIGFVIAGIFENPLLILPFAIIGGVTGLYRGREPFDVCCDPDCNARLPEEADMCARCGGTIRGRIRYADERLVAQEHLEQGVSWVDFTEQ